MIELRPYQAEGLTALWDYFAQGNKGNPLIAWPTGTGKSIVPAIWIRYVMGQWPNQRFLMITHVKELIQQNYDVLRMVWPNAPVSIYSAGLGLKNPAMPIVFGGVQSMCKHPAIFGWRDIIFIDEAHLINQHDTSMYKTFLSTMKLINPNVKIIGMSATPFRMGWGLITDPLVDEHGNDGRLFTDIVHDITEMESFNRLIAEGYISPLIPVRTHEELDITGVGVNGGEYIQSQLQAAVDKQDLNYKICQEITAVGANRRCWLTFASGIDHAEHLAENFRSFGISAAAIHSKQKSEYNDEAIKDFKNFKLRCIINYGKLTTGFNHPQIDYIPMVRATLSVPLWVQMLGRGTRPAEGKINCLVGDYARNTPRLGPINDPVIPRKKGEGVGDVPVKLCDSCGAYNHTRVQFCCQCGNEFQFRNKLVAKAGTQALLKSDIPEIIDYNVTYPTYAKKMGKSGGEYILVTYHCGAHAFKEFIFPEGKGSLKHKYHLWWRQRANIPPPETVDGVISHAKELMKPKTISVWANKKFPEVMRSEF
jgi:DNA repair protein RadD